MDDTNSLIVVITAVCSAITLVIGVFIGVYSKVTKARLDYLRDRHKLEIEQKREELKLEQERYNALWKNWDEQIKIAVARADRAIFLYEELNAKYEKSERENAHLRAQVATLENENAQLRSRVATLESISKGGG